MEAETVCKLKGFGPSTRIRVACRLLILLAEALPSGEGNFRRAITSGTTRRLMSRQNLRT